ncbi:MAG: YhcH/YjgK/YiaL family protein [Candidatus Marinarcus sp.]|uniref:YhcH/YjgK/YiaL family protein n=1 Tax=Candidatus Marinarcus sp. TaxID=3100987 RepID=UPI003B00898E
MAIFGKLELLKDQLPQEAFQKAFNYLKNISVDFLEIKEGECVKEFIDENIFVLHQAYKTKKRELCFFESHKKYVDMQYIVYGKEQMDVSNIEELTLLMEYNQESDFAKYENKQNHISTLLIQEQELAIFYPQDAHQPCIEVDESQLVYKAVIKIPVELL